MKQIENIIQKLKSDPLCAVKITDTHNDTIIGWNIHGRDMEAAKGSVEQYFNDLVMNRGIKSIAVQERRKNGSSYKSIGDEKLLNFEPKAKVQAPAAPVYPATPIPQDYGHLMGGLNAQVMYHHMDYPKMEAKAQRLEDENTRLKEQIAELKEAALENRFSEAKASGNKEMLGQLAQILTPLATAMISSKTGGAVPGLGSPAVDETLTDMQQECISIIRQAPDDHTGFISIVLQGLKKDKEFANELYQLFLKHKLIS